MSQFHLFVGRVLRLLPPIRGRHRLQRWWLAQPYQGPSQCAPTPSGARLSCDLAVPYEAMVWLGREEWDDLGMLPQLLRPGQCFVDVGANIGTWSIEAAMRVGPSGRVDSFEPNPLTVAKLAANVALNHLDSRISVHACAVSAELGQVTMICAREHNNSRVVASAVREATSIPAVSLDRHFGSEALVHALKIDVEGHELSVLRGAEALVARCRPWIIVEFNLDLTAAPQLGGWDVHQWLVTRGYLPEPLPSTGCSAVTEDYRPSVVRYANLLYRPAP